LHRDILVSSARVAYHYSYSLREAVSLSQAERELLLSVASAEAEVKLQGLEDALGTRWSADELLRVTSQSVGGALPSFIRTPLVPMLAPDAFKQVQDDFKKRASQTHKNRRAGVLEVGSLSTGDAKKFFKNLGGLGE
jgi:hypothetical protein